MVEFKNECLIQGYFMVKMSILGYVYKLQHKEKDCGIYVGSTVDWEEREKDHRYNCNCKHKKFIKVYRTINANDGFENWEMIPIASYYHDTKEELAWKERNWYEKLEPTLNSYRPRISREERKELHRISCQIYKKKNKEQLDKKRKSKVMCDCGSIIQKMELARHRRTKKHINYMTNVPHLVFAE